MVDLREVLKSRYIEKFRKRLLEESGDRRGIRTSDVTSSCLRRCYFNVISKEDNEFGIEPDLNTLNIFFQGHAYHSILISNMYIDKNGKPQLFDEERHKIIYDEVHDMYLVVEGGKVIGIYGAEVPVSYKDMIRGKLDELWLDEDTGEVYIIDKKTVTKFPQDIYPHYRRQVSYYMVMLRDTFPTLEVNKGMLLYILNKTKYEFDVECSEMFEVDVDSVQEELEGKLKLLNHYLTVREIPPASPSDWECRFCSYKQYCSAYKKMSSLDSLIGKENGNGIKNGNGKDKDKG